MLIDFFKTQVNAQQKGISNLIDKIVFYDEDLSILNEKPNKNDPS